MAEQRVVNLKLDLPEGIIELNLTVNEGPQLLSGLAADMFGFSDAVVSMGTGIAERFGRRITCAKGCGACCCQLVPLSPPEAVHIVNVVDSLDKDHKERVVDGFARAKKRLEDAGLSARVSALYDGHADQEEIRETNREYFALGIPCPFLADGSCGIHPRRPSRCREYSVMSPAEYCTNPFDPRVKRLPVTVRLGEALTQAWATLTGRPPVIVPLIDAFEWVERNNDMRLLAVEGAEHFVSAVLQYAAQSALRRAREKMAGEK